MKTNHKIAVAPIETRQHTNVRGNTSIHNPVGVIPNDVQSQHENDDCEIVIEDV